VGAGLLATGPWPVHKARRQESGPLNAGDIAILRFLAAAELIESDLWTQYAELGGIGTNPPIEVDPGQTLNNYQVALSNLDPDGPQYITSNTNDEITHATFLNAYLESRGAEPVNFDEFETLPGSTATRINRALGASRTSWISLSTPAGTFATAAQPIRTWAPPFLRRSLSKGLPPFPERMPISVPLTPISTFPVTHTFRRSRMWPAFTSDTLSKAVRVFTQP
jgi:hypothetical protein